MSRERVLLGFALAWVASAGVLAQDETVVPTDAAAEVERIQSGANIDGRAADDPLFDQEPSRCLSLSRVRRTEIIDDSTIVFYTGRRQAYVNNLPRRCPGLRTNSQFMYEVNQSRLCETDWITVLERFGLNVGRGFTCRLGVFHPADEETVDILRRAAETGLGAPASTATPVELPDDAEGSEADADGAAPQSETAETAETEAAAAEPPSQD